MDKLRVLSFGAGAIGTYIGGSLALAGHALSFVERPPVANRLRQQGLHLDLRNDPRRGAAGRFHLPPEQLRFYDSLADALAAGPYDVALFALKSYDTAAALETMRPLARQMPPLLCLQNGVENEAHLAEALGQDRVIAATVTSAVGRKAAGDIVLERLRGVGVAAGHPLAERLVAAFDAALLNARLYPRAADMKWSKMLTNLVGNATAAILDLPPSEIFAHPGLYRLEMAQLRECLAVMRAQNIRVVDLPGTPVRALAAAAYLPAWMRGVVGRVLAGGRGEKMPSFHIDLYAGRGKSEVTYLNGAVARYGARLGVPTPVNRLLTDVLLDLVAGRTPLSAYARQPEALLARWHSMIK